MHFIRHLLIAALTAGVSWAATAPQTTIQVKDAAGSTTTVNTQPQAGVAGTPSPDVMSVQGVTSGTPIRVIGGADQFVVTGSIDGTGQSVIITNMGGFNGANVIIYGTFSITISIQQSPDAGVTWLPVVCSRTDSIAASQVVTASSQTAAASWWLFSPGATQLRVTSTAYVSGTMQVRLEPTTFPVPAQNVVTGSGTFTCGQTGTWTVMPGNTQNTTPWLVSGKDAVSAGTSVNPVYVGGRVTTSLDTSLTNGDAFALNGTTAGQAIVALYGSAENKWRFTTSLTTTTTAAAARAAGAASIRNYVGAVQAQNTSATATTLLIQDGATTIWQCQLPASMALPMTVEFNTAPLQGTAATALNYNFGTAGATVLLNVQGYQSF